MVKSTLLLSLAALSTAFVIPDEATFQQLEVETHQGQESVLSSLESARQTVESSSKNAEVQLESFFKTIHHSVNDVVNGAEDTIRSASNKASDCYSHAQGWIDSASEQMHEASSLSNLGLDEQARPGHGHHKPNQTVYQLIAGSKYTTKLAKLINDYPDLVEALNGTAANYTVFARKLHINQFIDLVADSHTSDRPCFREDPRGCTKAFKGGTEGCPALPCVSRLLSRWSSAHNSHCAHALEVGLCGSGEGSSATTEHEYRTQGIDCQLLQPYHRNRHRESHIRASQTRVKANIRSLVLMESFTASTR